MSRLRSPEVVVFRDPSGARRPRKGKEAAVPEASAERRGSPQEYSVDFKATLLEAASLAREEEEERGQSGGGRRKRQLEKQHLIALGAKPPRRPPTWQRVPFPAPQQQRQRVLRGQEDGSARRLADTHSHAHGKSLGRNKTHTRRSKGRGRWQEQPHSLLPAVGRLRAGVLRLSSTELQTVRSLKNKM